MEPLSKDDVALISLQVLCVALMLPTAIVAMYDGDYSLMMFDSTIAFINAIFTLINIDKWTQHGKYNNEFFAQKVW